MSCGLGGHKLGCIIAIDRSHTCCNCCVLACLGFHLRLRSFREALLMATLMCAVGSISLQVGSNLHRTHACVASFQQYLLDCCVHVNDVSCVLMRLQVVHALDAVLSSGM